MTEYVGNAIPAPGYAKGGQTVDDELLYSMVGYHQKGVTLKQGQGVLPLGTFLKQDAATKKYIKATVASEVQGVLRQTTDTGTDAGATAQVWSANILYGGMLKLAAVSTANAIADLSTVLGARVDTVAGFFKF
jgi:hypothetical protein